MQLARRPDKVPVSVRTLDFILNEGSLVTWGFKGALLGEAWEWKEKKIVWATGILKAGGPIEIECFDYHRTLSGKK